MWPGREIRAAYEASAKPEPATSDHTFRDPVFSSRELEGRAHDAPRRTRAWYDAKVRRVRGSDGAREAERNAILGEDHPDRSTPSRARRARALRDRAEHRGDSGSHHALERVNGARVVRVAIAERNWRRGGVPRPRPAEAANR